EPGKPPYRSPDDGRANFYWPSGEPVHRGERLQQRDIVEGSCQTRGRPQHVEKRPHLNADIGEGLDGEVGRVAEQGPCDCYRGRAPDLSPSRARRLQT